MTSTTSTTSPLEAPHDAASRKIELLISNLLRTGVVVSLFLVAFGTTLSFVHHRDYFRERAALHRITTPADGPAAFPHTLRDVVSGLRELRGQAVVTLGLLLLIATPVLRVAVSILAFAIERDRPYVLITTIVLLLLILSFALGAVERT